VDYWDTWIPLLVALVGGAVTLATVIFSNSKGKRHLEALKLLREARAVGASISQGTRAQLDAAELALATRVSEQYRVYGVWQKVLLALWISLAPLGLLVLIGAGIVAVVMPGGVPSDLIWIPQGAIWAVGLGTVAGVGLIVTEVVLLSKARPAGALEDEG
jgi:hypothetical protein